MGEEGKVVPQVSQIKQIVLKMCAQTDDTTVKSPNKGPPNNGQITGTQDCCFFN